MERRTAHLDMDAFYASVELLRYPELRGLSVVIGGKLAHDAGDDRQDFHRLRQYTGRGVVITAGDRQRGRRGFRSRGRVGGPSVAMRIGVDLGGTKIEGIVMDERSRLVARERVATPQGDYWPTLEAIAGVVRRLEAAVACQNLPVGVGHPGAISPSTGLLKNSNSTCLNGHPFKQDLEAVLGHEVYLANDADCLAVSEARDGAAAGAANVFAVILGTGVGGGIAIGGRLLRGPNAIAGEWGHNPLPWIRPEWNELPGAECWCGRHGCIETWLSGVGLARDHERVTAERLSAEAIVQRAEAGEERAAATVSRYEDRLARALAHVINLLDPDVIVLGGGVSGVERLYRTVPTLWDQWVFSDRVDTKLLPALHGDSSGVRGAAFLCPGTQSRW